MIAEQKKQVDFIGVAGAAGVELDRSGIGLCPFHDEKTASFKVFPDNHYKCFGCGEYGDVIDFIQKIYGLSFPDALKHLGIERGQVSTKRRYTCEAGRSTHTQNVIREFQDFFGIQNIPKRTNPSRKSLEEFFGRSDMDRHARYQLANLRNFFEEHRRKQLIGLKAWVRRHAYLR